MDLGFSRFCNTISPSNEKNLGWYGLDGWYIKWVKNRLDRDQIFICQWLTLGPIRLKIFSDNLDKEIGWTVFELSDDIRLRKMTDILDHNVKLGNSMPLQWWRLSTHFSSSKDSRLKVIVLLWLAPWELCHVLNPTEKERYWQTGWSTEEGHWGRSVELSVLKLESVLGDFQNSFTQSHRQPDLIFDSALFWAMGLDYEDLQRFLPIYIILKFSPN